MKQRMNEAQKYELKEAIKLIVILGLVFYVGLFYLFHAEPDVLQTLESPDGKYVAYVFESNGGATTGFIYHISVYPKWRPLTRGNGNVWIHGSPPIGVKWTGDRELLVDIYRSEPSRKETWVWGVDIVYTN